MVTKTPTKKTTTKKAPAKKTEVKTDVILNKDLETEQENTVNKDLEAVKEPKVYKDDDFILCRSITLGELIHIGMKSGIRYIFAGKDDTCEIEVGDLNALKARKSDYLYKPYFVVDDEEFLSQPRWADINAMYDQFKKEDIEELLNKPVSRFRALLSQMPDGYKKLVSEEVADRIHKDEFDSLQKIKAIDEICGTDLYCLIK